MRCAGATDESRRLVESVPSGEAVKVTPLCDLIGRYADLLARAPTNCVFVDVHEL